MSSWQQFALALVGAAFPWMTIWVVTKMFLLSGKQSREANDRLLGTIDDLTAQSIAFKNPWAAEMFAKHKQLSERPPQPQDNERDFDNFDEQELE